jgi:hypothetical protein
MPVPPSLPRTLYAELGKLSVIWANIEQDLIMQTSAMCAQDTDGVPIAQLRTDFKRLREKWYDECRKRFDAKVFNKVVHPLNMQLCRFAPVRGNCIHGLWSVRGRGKYELGYFEQKGELQLFVKPYTIAELRRVIAASDLIAREVWDFTSGGHRCFKNRDRTLAKVT